MSRSIAVIGAGASGIFAALSAKRAGGRVFLFERNEIIGKKLLVTGNGRCNFSNRALSDLQGIRSGYPAGAFLAESVLSRFGLRETVKLFEETGIIVYDKEGYLYPGSNHASSVRDALELLLKREAVDVRTKIKVTGITPKGKGEGFLLTMCGDDGVMHTGEFDSCIMTCGGRAYPDTGSDGFGYKLCKRLEIPLVRPLPALTKCMFEEDPLSLAAGVRCDCALTLMIDSKISGRERGQLQILKDALSGIVVFQLSGRAVRAFEEGKKAVFILDLYPDVPREKFGTLLSERIRTLSGVRAGELFTGMFVKPLSLALLDKAGINADKPAGELNGDDINSLSDAVKAWEIRMSGHGSFSQCQVTGGGIELSAVDENLMIKKIPGLFAAGEMLDVDGICGGYNLQFAISSGIVAGEGAARIQETEYGKSEIQRNP